jgi:hypothetical protein
VIGRRGRRVLPGGYGGRLEGEAVRKSAKTCLAHPRSLGLPPCPGLAGWLAGWGSHYEKPNAFLQVTPDAPGLPAASQSRQTHHSEACPRARCPSAWRRLRHCQQPCPPHALHHGAGPSLKHSFQRYWPRRCHCGGTRGSRGHCQRVALPVMYLCTLEHTLHLGGQKGCSWAIRPHGCQLGVTCGALLLLQKLGP